MQFRGLDLNLLVALDVLLSERNVTRAAERLHVSQPAMSASLQRLRNHFADPLLQRVGHQLELTPRAMALAGPTKEFLYRIRNLLADDGFFDPNIAEKTFSVAMTGYCTEVFGINLMHRVAELAPNIRCQFQELRSNALVRLYEGQLDFCVMLADRASFDPTYQEDNSCERLLFSDEFVLIGDAGNPLFQAPVSYERFCAQPYIEVRLTDTFTSVVEQALRRKAERPIPCVSVPTFLTAMLMVKGSSMVAIVPSMLMDIHGKDYGLVAVPPPLRLASLDEAALWHPRSEADPAHRWLQGIMVEVAAALPVNGKRLRPSIKQTDFKDQNS